MRADHAAEVVGIAVYTAAAGEPITMALVKTVIAELASSGDDDTREAACQAKPARVFHTVALWQSNIATQHVHDARR